MAHPMTPGGAPSDVLTDAEFEVCRRMALGQTWEQVMAALGIARSTLQHHRLSALAKVGGGVYIDLLRDIGWLIVPGPRPQ